jgi:hypothetical protein
MLRRTLVVLKVNPFSLFMKETRGHKLLKKLTAVKRGVMLSKMYKKLTPIEKAGLEKRALNTTFARKKKVAVTKPRKMTPTKYTIFVSEQFKLLTGPSRLRMKAISKLWKEQQKKKVKKGTKKVSHKAKGKGKGKGKK